MQLKIYKDHQQLSISAADEIVTLLNQKPDAVICFASGETPRLTCRLFVEKVKQQKIDISQCTFIGLDEWVGVPPSNDGSCHYFFQHELLSPLDFKTEQVYLFNSMSENLVEECKKMDTVISAKGGIDLVIVGIGMNGHIGFNEPGVSFDNHCHVIDLEESTISVGQKYFKSSTKLEKGITLGLKYLQQSKKVLLLANGIKKAGVIQQAIEGSVSNSFPASIIQTLPQGIVMIDEDASSALKSKN